MIESHSLYRPYFREMADVKELTHCGSEEAPGDAFHTETDSGFRIGQNSTNSSINGQTSRGNQNARTIMGEMWLF